MKYFTIILCYIFYTTCAQQDNDTLATSSSNNTDIINGGEDYSDDQTTMEDAQFMTEVDVNSLNNFEGEEMVTTVSRIQLPPLWPRVKGKLQIPFIISKSFTSAQRRLILHYVKKMNGHLIGCNVNEKPVWIPRKNETNFIHFIRSTRCSSFVGYINRPNQFIYLANGCFSGTILHEMLHAMGFWHEHQRPDRDDYVKILLDNIKEGPLYLRQFRKITSRAIRTRKTPYDYTSIMHYSMTAFQKSEGLKTIETLRPAEIGQRVDMSIIDIYEVNKVYQCRTKIAMRRLWTCNFNKLCRDTKITKWTRTGGGYLRTKLANASVTAILLKNSFPAASALARCPCNNFGSCTTMHFCVQFTYLVTSAPTNSEANTLRVDGYSTQTYGKPVQTKRVSSSSVYIPSGIQANIWTKMKATIKLPCGQYMSFSVTTASQQSKQVLVDDMFVNIGHC